VDPELPRWAEPCQDDFGRDHLHRVELLADGRVRLVPPLAGDTVWSTEQLGQLIADLVAARAASQGWS
jgi:hypothetical protein